MTQPQQPHHGGYPGQPGQTPAPYPGPVPAYQPPGIPQPYPQPGPPADAGWLRLHLEGSFWTNSLIAPTATLDGYPVTLGSSHGVFQFPVPPGRHRIHLHQSWLRTYGSADLDFVAMPGQVVDVFYKAPMHQFADRGNIGFVPQERPGVGVFIAILLIPVAVTAIFIVLALLIAAM